MRICYVVHQFLPRYFTGTEQYVFAVASEARRRGHDVEVFALDPEFGEHDPLVAMEREFVAGLPVTRIRYWMMLAPFERLEYRHPELGMRFARYLETVRPDVVHFFHLRHLGANLIDEARLLGIPAVAHLMDFWYLCPRVTLQRGDGALCGGPPDGGMGCIPCAAPAVAERLGSGVLAELQAWRSAASAPPAGDRGPVATALALLERPGFLRERLLACDAIVAPSRFLADLFARNGLPAARIEVVGYGVDRARLGGLDPQRPRPERPLTIGFLGSIAPHKGPDTLIDAFLAIEGRAALLVYGRATDFAEFSGPLVERAGRDPRIEFRGPFERDRLGEVLAAIDVLAVPSRWYENTPFVALEAFAAGVPVVASDLGGLAEIVRDGIDGELFPAGDSAELARRIRRLLAEPDRIDRYRAAAPAVKDQVANQVELERIYERVVAARGAGA